MYEVEGFDRKSMKLGMIQAFCEVVMQEVKELALSPVIEPEEWPALEPASEIMTGYFGVQSYVEKELLSTDLATDEAVKGKIVVLYFKEDSTLEAYLALKGKVDQLQAEGRYTDAERVKASIAMRRLLSYSEKVIAEKYPDAQGV